MPRARARRDLAHREDQRGARGDVIHDQQPRARRERALDRLGDARLAVGRAGQIHRPHHRPGALGDESRRLADRPIHVVRDHDLVAGGKFHRAQHGGDAGRGVVHEHEVVRARAEKLRHGLGGLPHARLRAHHDLAHVRELADQEARGIALDLVADRLLRREHALGRRADRAVIEVRDRGIEHPLAAHRAPELAAGAGRGVGHPARNRSARRARIGCAHRSIILSRRAFTPGHSASSTLK